ncbi:DUF1573 domain-containing protein [Rapidithrix thailandica]|uniref:DUF1573 domain-containing protein n=1 Tax=Rapidithrix thailandica TaxID=413964 RepID=A0AAW9SEB1_9BACT
MKHLITTIIALCITTIGFAQGELKFLETFFNLNVIEEKEKTIYTFEIENPSNEPVSIYSTSVFCQCITIDFPFMSFGIKPGFWSSFKVIYDKKCHDQYGLNHHEGDIRDITIRTNAKNAPDKLEVQGFTIILETWSNKKVQKKQDNGLQGRQVKQQGTFKVDGNEIEIRLWDQRKVDGDVVSLKFNGEWVVKDYALRKRKKTILLTFDPDQKNELILFAKSLGKEPPNTAALSIKNGKKVRRMSLQADLNYCGSIRFVQ